MSPSAAPRGVIECDQCKRIVSFGKELWSCASCNYQMCDVCKNIRSTRDDAWGLRHLAPSGPDPESSVLAATVATLAKTIESLSAEVVVARAEASRLAERAARAERATEQAEMQVPGQFQLTDGRASNELAAGDARPLVKSEDTATAARVQVLEGQLARAEQEVSQVVAKAEANERQLREANARCEQLQALVVQKTDKVAEYSQRLQDCADAAAEREARLNSRIAKLEQLAPSRGEDPTQAQQPPPPVVEKPQQRAPEPAKHVREGEAKKADGGAAKRNDGGVALHLAAYKGQIEYVNTLLDGGEDIEARVGDGRTPLMLSAEGGHTETLRMLLERRADIEARANNGANALVYAATRGQKKAVQALLEGGANVEAQSNDGATALIYAALGGHREAAEALLDGGANAGVEVGDRTALNIAADNGHTLLVELLRSREKPNNMGN